MATEQDGFIIPDNVLEIQREMEARRKPKEESQQESKGSLSGLMDARPSGERQRGGLRSESRPYVAGDERVQAPAPKPQTGSVFDRVNPDTVQPGGLTDEEMAAGSIAPWSPRAKQYNLKDAKPTEARAISDAQFRETVKLNEDRKRSLADRAGRIGLAALHSANRGAAGVGRAAAELAAPVGDFLEPSNADEMAGWRGSMGGNPLRRLAEGFDISAQNSGAVTDDQMLRLETDTGRAVQSGLMSFAQNLPSMGMALLPGGQSLALGSMAAMSGGNAYQDAREKGLAQERSLPYAIGQAGIEYLTEKIPVSKFIGSVRQNDSFAKALTKQIASEVPGEQVATFFQDLNEWAALHPEKTIGQFAAERPDAAYQTLVSTLVASGANAGLAKAFQVADAALGTVDTIAQQHGLSPKATVALREQASALPPEEQPGFIKRALRAFERRNMVKKPGAETAFDQAIAEQLAATPEQATTPEQTTPEQAPEPIIADATGWAEDSIGAADILSADPQPNQEQADAAAGRQVDAGNVPSGGPIDAGTVPGDSSVVPGELPGAGGLEPAGASGGAAAESASPAQPADDRDALTPEDIQAFTPKVGDEFTIRGEKVKVESVKGFGVKATGPSGSRMISKTSPTWAAMAAQAMPVSQPKTETQPEASIGRASVSQPVKPKVYKSRGAVDVARKEAGNTLKVQKVKGGFILRPKSDAEIAAEEKNAKRLTARKSVNVESDPLLVAIAKLGGLSPNEKADTIGQGNKLTAGGHVFRGSGFPLDTMAEYLAEDGYIPQQEIDRDGGTTWLRDAIKAEHMGSRQHFSQRGEGWMEDRVAEMQRQAEMAADEQYWPLADLSADDLEASGYTRASPEVQALTERLMADAEAAGIDTEAIRERVAMQTSEGATADDYEQALQDAINEALAGNREAAQGDEQGADRPSGEDRGQDDGGEGQAAGQAEGLTLQAETEADAQAKAEREAAALKAEADTKAAEQERLRREAIQREERARADATVDDFQLGQTADQQLSGQADMFAVPDPAPAPAPKPEPKADKPAEPKQGPEGISPKYSAGDRLTPDLDVIEGDIVRHDGKLWMARVKRGVTVPLAPIIDGKPQVSADSVIRVDLRENDVRHTGANVYGYGAQPTKPAEPAAAQPDALALTPKQYHEAKLRSMALANDTTLAEVREMYDTDGGRAANEQEWVERVIDAAQAGTMLARSTLDKLLELRPNTRLPETAIPNGYQRPEARKAEADAADAKRDDRRALRQRANSMGIGTDAAPADTATPAPTKPDAEAAPSKPNEIALLTKRLSVLEQLRTCLQE